MMATADEVTELRDDVADVKREVVLVRKDMEALEERVNGRFEVFQERVDGRFAAMEERVDGRFAAMEERMDGRFALLEERMNTMGQELRALFETEIRRAITVQTLIQVATMVGLVWAARG